MLKGKFEHEDSTGAKGIMSSGDVQWMKTGRGIIHSEMPAMSDGQLLGFQLWINMPAKLKKNKPSLKIRNGRELIKFDNLEFSRIFMAWFIPNLNDQKNIIGLEILASILSVGRNSRLVKILKEDSNLVESVYVDVNAGELGGLFIMEASCESKDIDLVEKQINKTIDEISNCNALALDEIKKAINIVKSNYIFNLETSTQLSSFFGNELLWGRKSSINNLESHLKYWNDLDNFKEITEYIRGEKFTLVASPGKC